MIPLGRIERLREAHLILEHTKHRTVKNISIWDRGDHSDEPIVVRKALGLALLIEETPARLRADVLGIGLRPSYGPLVDGGNITAIAKTIEITKR